MNWMARNFHKNGLNENSFCLLSDLSRAQGGEWQYFVQNYLRTKAINLCQGAFQQYVALSGLLVLLRISIIYRLMVSCNVLGRPSFCGCVITRPNIIQSGIKCWIRWRTLTSYRLKDPSNYSFKPQRARPPPGLTTVVRSRVRLVSDYDRVWPLHVRLVLIKRITKLRNKSENNLNLDQKWYIKNSDRRVCFAFLFRVGDYLFVNGAPLFCSAVRGSTLQIYETFSPGKWKTYKRNSVSVVTLRILQGGRDFIASIHGSTVSDTSRHTYHDDPVDKEARDCENWPGLNKEQDDNYRKRTTTPTLSTKLFDTPLSDPGFGISCVSTGTLTRVIPTYLLITYDSIILMRTSAD